METPLVKRESLTSGIFMELYVTGTNEQIYLWYFFGCASRFLRVCNNELLVNTEKALTQAKLAIMTPCDIKWFLVLNFNYIATSLMLASGGYSASVPLDPFRVPTLLVQGFPNGLLL